MTESDNRYEINQLESSELGQGGETGRRTGLKIGGASPKPQQNRPFLDQNSLERIADWIEKIQVGDVLRTKSNGFLRVVRAVDHHPATTRRSAKHYVAFVIQRCSWTQRCYTIYTQTELRRLFEPTGHRLELSGELDAKIALETTSRPKNEIQLRCCDVEGLA